MVAMRDENPAHGTAGFCVSKQGRALMTERIASDIAAALDRDDDVRGRFEALPSSHSCDHLTWIDDAKKPQTRARRIALMIERLRAQRNG
jgi:uncharacterized protein YdeI (YjbR/CyaY-like superfamily)